jgi:hypothetical protein
VYNTWGSTRSKEIKSKYYLSILLRVYFNTVKFTFNIVLEEKHNLVNLTLDLLRTHCVKFKRYFAQFILYVEIVSILRIFCSIVEVRENDWKENDLLRRIMFSSEQDAIVSIPAATDEVNVTEQVMKHLKVLI